MSLQSTFRDPTGALFDHEGRILRLVKPGRVEGFEAFVRSALGQGLVERGRLVGTRAIALDAVPADLRELEGTWFEHDRLAFVSVPAEWSAAMLAAAALHTLDLADELLKSGKILKDATPANILFEGARPVFVDVPSIEDIVAGQDVWMARNQFETTFILPLLAQLELDCPLQWSLADPARGLSHEQAAALYGPRRWLGSRRIRQVALPATIGRRARGHAVHSAASPSKAGHSNLERTRYVLAHSLGRLRSAILDIVKLLERRQSHWSAYTGERSHYSTPDLVAKRELVAEVLDRGAPRWTLDIGANTGEFSRLAVTKGSQVVAVDSDEISAGAIFSSAQQAGAPIHALVVDISRPTPATGWRNSEAKSFVHRATGRFDLALMLAVGHHLRVTAGVPLHQVLELGLQLGGGSLLFEFVPTDDPMFQTIARGRNADYSDNTVENCRALLAGSGVIELERLLPNGRTLFWARRQRR